MASTFTWEKMVSTLTLPKYVAFKGINQKYLCVREAEYGPQLQFVADDISDPTVTMEFIVTNNGDFHIKNTISGKIFNLGQYEYIVADTDDTSTDKRNTIFRPFKVNSNSIALLNMGNGKFCRNYISSDTEPDIVQGLRADIDFTSKYTWLRVEEPVTKREIYDIKYHLDQSKVYDNETVILAAESATNLGYDFDTVADLTLTYINIHTTLWKTILSLMLEAKDTFRFDVNNFPIIDGGEVKILDSSQELNGLDETRVTTNVVKVVKQVVVPPRTTTTVTLIATKGKCDVPFTFTQSDTLYNGETLTTDVEGDTYVGSNYYNFEFQIKQESVDARV